MKSFLTGAFAALVTTLCIQAADSEAGFVQLFDGKSLDGWKIAEPEAKSWSVQDGVIVAHGNRSHLFYVGDDKPFKDFEFKVDVMTEPGSNGGIYFHTKFQESSWPKGGFECQVNVSHTDYKKTGSLYDIANLGVTPAQDNKWWTQHITVKGNTVQVRIDGKLVIEYKEPPGTQAGKDFQRKLDQGTFAFQAHDPKSVIRYKNVRVKRL